MIYNHIISYLNENQILDHNQSGFRAKYSTGKTVAKLTDDICLNLNQGQATIATYIDPRKAFDMINHSILINKLPLLGFRDEATAWVQTYLNNRQQLTIDNNISSTLLLVNCGVPQGSTLAPLLFLMYINDIGKAILDSKFLLYADDTVIQNITHATHLMVQKFHG